MSKRESARVNRAFYQMGVATLISSLVWVGIGIYQALNKTSLAQVDKSTLEPISPAIDKEVIKSLANRLKVEGVILVSAPEATTSAESDTIEVEE